MDTLLQTILGEYGTSWITGLPVTDRNSLLDVIEQCRIVHSSFLFPSPGKEDPYIAAHAAEVVRCLCAWDGTWQQLVAPRISKILIRHAGIYEGPSWQVRMSLYQALSFHFPYPNDLIRQLATDEGRESKADFVLVYQALQYIFRAFPDSTIDILTSWPSETILKLSKAANSADWPLDYRERMPLEWTSHVKLDNLIHEYRRTMRSTEVLE